MASKMGPNAHISCQSYIGMKCGDLLGKFNLKTYEGVSDGDKINRGTYITALQLKRVLQGLLSPAPPSFF